MTSKLKLQNVSYVYSPKTPFENRALDNINLELESGIKNNLEALEQIINYAMDKDIPYFAVNVPNDTCLSCGYCDEFNDHCPECGSEDIQ